MKNKTILTLILGSVIAVFAILYFMYFRSVTVSFTAKIGAGIAPITVKVGEKITEPVAPKSDEYKFLGWYLDDINGYFDNVKYLKTIDGNNLDEKVEKDIKRIKILNILKRELKSRKGKVNVKK